MRLYGIAIGKLTDSIAEKLLPWLFLNVHLGDDAIGMVMSYEAAGGYINLYYHFCHFFLRQLCLCIHICFWLILPPTVAIL